MLIKAIMGNRLLATGC